ncbi:MAG: hypothetical protein JW958_12085 [Candidatus Eisenbacteria bacterium]|nr:hypothetical protein [Candidatus Eisenbacteria bacterium]
MRRGYLITGGLLIAMAFAASAFADCWCGNGYSDPNTNFVEAQVWPGDPDGMGTLTSMDFIYTTDNTDPKNSGTAVTEPGTFYQYNSNNDWYQAWLTAVGGDLVRWYVVSTSSDGSVCESDEFSFTSGVAPPEVPNLVGDCESELGGGDWSNGDALTDMADPEMDGIYSVTLTATADFTAGGGSGYQVVGVSGSWSPQYPGDSNIPISFVTSDVVEFFLDTNPMVGWSPESNAAYDGSLLAAGHTWAAVGDWQGWDPSNVATQMADIGGGVLRVQVYFDSGMLGTHEYKCAANGGWDLQAGVNGYGSNSGTWSFEVTQEGWVGFYLHESGRIKVVLDDVTATENATWGSVKTLFR